MGEEEGTRALGFRVGCLKRSRSISVKASPAKLEVPHACVLATGRAKPESPCWLL